MRVTPIRAGALSILAALLGYSSAGSCANKSLPSNGYYPDPAITGEYYAALYAGSGSKNLCQWDSQHDVAPCINAATQAASAAGGGTVIVPAGTFALRNSLQLQNSVRLVGAGGASWHCGTTFIWGGATGAAMIQSGDSGMTSQVVNPGLRQICLDGAGIAGYGVTMWSTTAGDFDHIYIARTTSAGWYVNEANALSPNAMSAFNLFKEIYIDLGDPASSNSKGWVLASGAQAGDDTNRNTWIGGYVIYQNNTAFECGAADANVIINMDFQPSTLEVTGKAVDLLGGSGINNMCHGNFFYGYPSNSSGAGGGTVAEGGAYPSFGNMFFGYKLDDGETLPKINNGASVYWMDEYGNTNLATGLSMIAVH